SAEATRYPAPNRNQKESDHAKRQDRSPLRLRPSARHRKHRRIDVEHHPERAANQGQHPGETQPRLREESKDRLSRGPAEASPQVGPERRDTEDRQAENHGSASCGQVKWYRSVNLLFQLKTEPR